MHITQQKVFGQRQEMGRGENFCPSVHQFVSPYLRLFINKLVHTYVRPSVQPSHLMQGFSPPEGAHQPSLNIVAIRYKNKQTKERGQWEWGPALGACMGHADSPHRWIS